MKELIRSLRKAQIEPVVLGDRILCSPFGGRILGLFPDGEHNLFWVADEIYTDSIGFINQNGWRNVGGDRTWLSPELSFHGDPNSWQSYSIQETIDPGEYRIVSSADNSVTMLNELKPIYRPTNTCVPLRIEKKIISIDTSPGALPASMQAVGYELLTRISTDVELPEHMQPGIWNILQVPGRGKVIAPTSGHADPRRFIGNPDVDVYDNRIEIEGSTENSFKCGIHINVICGVMMYRKSLVDGRESLVVRTFETDPEGAYSDIPADDPHAFGYIEQFYVDDGGLGGFVELEYHSPSLSINRTSLVNRSTVWGFIGEAEDIETIIEEYLGRRC